MLIFFHLFVYIKERLAIIQFLPTRNCKKNKQVIFYFLFSKKKKKKKMKKKSKKQWQKVGPVRQDIFFPVHHLFFFLFVKGKRQSQPR
jgi:hypothetical protein